MESACAKFNKTSSNFVFNLKKSLKKLQIFYLKNKLKKPWLDYRFAYWDELCYNSFFP
jgi:hypothetical protein